MFSHWHSAVQDWGFARHPTGSTCGHDLALARCAQKVGKGHRYHGFMLPPVGTDGDVQVAIWAESAAEHGSRDTPLVVSAQHVALPSLQSKRPSR